MKSRDPIRWELIDLDVLRPQTEDLLLTEGAGAYVIVWADNRPLGIEGLRPVDGRIARQELDALARKYRSCLRALDPPSWEFQPCVSVVVCTYRRDEPLRTILAAIDQQDYAQFEIIVVDNAPRESTARTITAGVPRARYVAEPCRGISHTRNAGLRAAHSDIIAFLDDDCLVHRRWLAALVSGFQEPGVACCTGPILPRELRTRAQQLLELRGGFNRGFERRVFSVDCPDAQTLCLPLHAYVCGSGANMAFRKSVLDTLGGFRTELPTAEDIDAFSRVMRHGHKILYEPGAAVRHDHPVGYASLRRRMYNWGRGHIAYLLNVAATDPAYRDAAIADVRNWFSYQIRRRLWPQLLRRDPFPVGLTIRELAGGLASVVDLWRGRTRARPHGPRKTRRPLNTITPGLPSGDAPDLHEATERLRGLLADFEAFTYQPSERPEHYRVQQSGESHVCEEPPSGSTE